MTAHLWQAKEATSANRIKRVKSDNSLQPKPSSSASDEWQAIPPSTQAQAETSHAEVSHPPAAQRRQEPPQPTALQQAEARQGAGAPSPPGRAASGQLQGSPAAADAGNVMGMPATTAQWRSKGGFIGRPRARVPHSSAIISCRLVLCNQNVSCILEEVASKWSSSWFPLSTGSKP